MTVAPDANERFPVGTEMAGLRFNDVWDSENYDDFHLHLIDVLKTNPDELPKGYLRYGMFVTSMLSIGVNPT